MERLTFWTPLVVLAVFLCHLQTSTACSCLPATPQQQFCQSAFVALVEVQNIETVNPNKIAYKVHVNQILKAEPSARIAMQQNPLSIQTSSQSSTCGQLALKPHETWVVGGFMIGSQLRLTLCNLAMLWSDVTPSQRDDFLKSYQSGCSDIPSR